MLSSARSPKREIDGEDPNGIVIHDKNEYLGKERWLHLTALAREVEKLTGKKFLIERDIPKREWEVDQAALKEKSDNASLMQMQNSQYVYVVSPQYKAVPVS